MKCDQFWEKISEDWRPGQELSKELTEHLDSCARCADTFEHLAGSLSEIKQAVKGDEPASFWLQMKKEILDQVEPPLKVRKSFLIHFFQGNRFIFNPVAAGVFAMLVLFLIWSLLHRGPNPSTGEPGAQDIYILAGGSPGPFEVAELLSHEKGDETLEDEMADAYEGAFSGLSDDLSLALIDVLQLPNKEVLSPSQDEKQGGIT